MNELIPGNISEGTKGKGHGLSAYPLNKGNVIRVSKEGRIARRRGEEGVSKKIDAGKGGGIVEEPASM